MAIMNDLSTTVAALREKFRVLGSYGIPIPTLIINVAYPFTFNSKKIECLNELLSK